MVKYYKTSLALRKNNFLLSESDIGEIVKQDKLDLLLSTKKIKNIKPINENTYLRNYIPLIDSKFCFEQTSTNMQKLEDLLSRR